MHRLAVTDDREETYRRDRSNVISQSFSGALASRSFIAELAL